MAKGSQFTQLKTALSDAGLTRQPAASKKRKRTNAALPSDCGKKIARLEEIHQQLNPFDTKVTKLKHDVGGRKVRGVAGRPAQSKQSGLEERKRTLLKEIKEKDHAGGILDRRFGENDPSMTPEERMLERFTRERQRASRTSAFHLEDEDELTHYGQSLSKIDDFDNTGFGLDSDGDEDETSDPIDGTIKMVHFGALGDEEGDQDGLPARKKSKAEVMSEVMAKSKEHKALRQESKLRHDDLRVELDNELEAIRSLLFAPDASLIPIETATLPNAPILASSIQHDRDRGYDQIVRELAFDKRAQPKDRSKTEEELALDEKKQLEKAERRRIRRMNGEDDHDSDDELSRKTRRGADDLDDDFADPADDRLGLGSGLVANYPSQSIPLSGDEQSSEDSDDSLDSDGGTQQGDDGIAESSDISGTSGTEDESRSESNRCDRTKEHFKPAVRSDELPFTFPCPRDHEEFLDIVREVQNSDVPVVVQRMRTLYHASLAEGNKLKLQDLAVVLIDHILYITSFAIPNSRLVTALLPHLFELTLPSCIRLANHVVSKLSTMQKNFTLGLTIGATEPSAKTFPGLPELTLLRIVSVIWSTSDMHHPVVSPARALMGGYLGLARVRSLRDLASGLAICSLWLDYEELSKRFVPEALGFTVNALLLIAPHPFEDLASIPGHFLCGAFQNNACTDFRIGHRFPSKHAPADLAGLLSDVTNDDKAKASLLTVSIDLLTLFAAMYKDLDAFIELFQPIFAILDHIQPRELPEWLRTRLSGLRDSLRRLLKFSQQSRKPLLLQAHKPIPIPTYMPKFEMSGSSYLRNQDPDRERNEAAKLRKQYKQEKKGALRELRKDSRFLAGVQQQEQQEKDHAYANQMNRVMASLEGERAEGKAIEKEKEKLKKRAGRR